MPKKSKLICVSNRPSHIRRMRRLALQNNYEFSSFSEEEWATIEEIDQHIPDEEISTTNATSLPLGVRPLFSLDDVEAKAIKRVIYKVNGNAARAARALNIGRATLYRKLDRYGFNLKYVRREQDRQEKRRKILPMAKRGKKRLASSRRSSKKAA